MDSQRTFIAIKPDGVQRALIGRIISRFEERGFQLTAMCLVVPGRCLAEEHYVEHKDKSYFKDFDFFTSGPVCAMVWEGPNVVAMARRMIGATAPSDYTPGTIRGDYAVSMARNVIHGSSNPEDAEREIKLWFGRNVVRWTPTRTQHLYKLCTAVSTE